MNRGARPPGTHTTSFWTAAVYAQLRKLWAAGMSTKTIGERLGCSKNSIIGRAHRLELKPRASPIKGGAAVANETRARNKAAQAAAVSALVEKLRANKPPAAPQMPVEAPVSPEPPLAAVDGATGPVRECQWPIGHPRKPGFHFCGAPAVPDRPYCRCHCEIAYLGFGRPRPEPYRVWQPGKPIWPERP